MLKKIFKDRITDQNGVFLASDLSGSFEEYYIKIRDIEERVLNDNQVSNLPNLDHSHPHHKEWLLRQESTERFRNYLKKNKKNSLLEIGCGNGWFTNQCSEFVQKAVGIDVNITELKQARKVFTNESIEYVYWNIFDEIPFNVKFDIIVINATIQYFQDLDRLFKRLEKLLKANGELHIIDSPFYPNNEIEAAKERSKAYYCHLDVPEMAQYYYHHSLDNVKGFKVMHSPKKTLIHKILRKQTNPFSWYRRIY